MHTKKKFLEAVSRNLIECHDWARDPARHAKFMASVIETVNGAKTCSIDGPAFQRAWREVGGKGKPTFKGIHALPDGDAQNTREENKDETP
jgi:hypothetical protein